MLEVKIAGEAFDLSEDIQINLIIENPLLNFDKIPVPLTLAFEVPATSKNLRLTKYPNRITSFRKIAIGGSEIVFNGISFLKGIIEVLGFNQKIKLSFKGVDIFEDLKQKMFAVALPEYPIGQANYTVVPGRPTRPGSTNPNGDRYQLVFDRTNPSNLAYKYWKFFDNAKNPANNAEFFVAPVKVVAGTWQTYYRQVRKRVPDTNIYYEDTIQYQLPATSADEMYLNFYNVAEGNFNITKNWKQAYTSQNGARPTLGYTLSGVINTGCFPFPYVHSLMDHFFAGTLINNPFKVDPELAKLCLVTSYHPYWRSATDGDFGLKKLQGMLFTEYHPVNSSLDHVVKQADFMPDIPINEALRDLMKMFCLSLFPVFGKFKLVKNEDVMQDVSVENWQSKLIDKPSTELMEAKVYNYGYDIDDEDTEGIEDIVEVTSVTAMINFAMETDNVIVFKIKNTGEVFQKEIIDKEIVYTRLNSGFGKAEETTGETFDAISALAPLPMGVHPYWSAITGTKDDKPAMLHWYCPEVDVPRTERPTTTSVMFARGMITPPNGDAQHQYPFLSANHLGPSGEVIGGKSLAWEGDKGLLETFHKSFKSWIEKDKVKISASFLLSALDLKQLDLEKKKHVDGKAFYLEKLQVTLTKDQIKPALVDLIEA